MNKPDQIQYCECGWPLLADGTCSDAECPLGWGEGDAEDIQCPDCEETLPITAARCSCGWNNPQSPDYDPTPYCSDCGAQHGYQCDCGPRAEND